MTHSCPAGRRCGKHKTRRYLFSGDEKAMPFNIRPGYPIFMAVTDPPSDSARESPDSLAAALRTLRPIEEKVLRLSYGIGCERAHSTAEIAAVFEVGADLVAAILEEGERRLAERGVLRDQLQPSGPPESASTHRCRSRSAERD